ncbi:Cytoskeleton associated protein 5 [Nowakowskiella sp. JEL0407]|nr:Cytoskeleton associated protein 5 [Nowakowskiella sp. JEL0407]
MGDAGEDFTQLSLPDKLSHKSWKARTMGYTDLEKVLALIDPDEPSSENEFRKYTEYLKPILTDGNAVALETGLSAVYTYVKNSPSGLRTRQLVLPLVLDKCLPSTRPGTKQKALEIVLMYIELDKNAEAVIEEIIPVLGHKSPKNVVAAIITLRESVRLFGTKIVGPKFIAKHLPKIFDHKDKNVRAEGVELTLELYRWVGMALLNVLSDLKPVQMKELQEKFEALPPSKPKPERYIRSEQIKMQNEPPPAEEDGEEEDEADDGGEAEELEAVSLKPAINVLDKMPGGFYENIAATKWQERKEALESLLNMIKGQRLEDGRYHELLGVLGKKVDKDANIVVAVLAVNCIQELATGLKESFAQYKSLVLGPLIGKLKEKKQNVVDALRAALDAVFNSFLNINEIAEEVVANMGHKNPNVRLETALWVARSLKVGGIVGKAEGKILVEAAAKGLDDSVEDIRNAASDVLGTLLKVLPERAVLPTLEKLESIKAAKVREKCEEAVTKVINGALAIKGGKKKPAPAKPQPQAAPPPKPAAASIASAASSRPSTASKSSGPPKKTGVPKKAATGSTSAKSSAPAPAKKEKEDSDAPVTFKYTEDSGIMWVEEAFPTLKVAELSNSAWKTRLAEIQSFDELIKAKEASEVEAEAIVAVLTKKPGFKDSNFQVMNSFIGILEYLAKSCPSFNKAAASQCASNLFEKLPDIKLFKSTSAALMSIAERTTLQFVLKESYSVYPTAKNPKVIELGMKWTSSAIEEFGVVGVSLKSLIDVVKTVGLVHANSAVRKESINVIAAVFAFKGPEIRTLIQDVNPQLLTTIDAEFEKVAARGPVVATRVQQVEEGDAAETEEIIPRVDISNKITPQLIEQLADAQWKTRQAALDQVIEILDGANRKIKSNIGDLPGSLKLRLNDTNKNLAIKALEICGILATSIGKQFEKHAKLLGSPIISCLADQKPHVRAAALSSLDKLYEAIGFEALLPSLSQSLMLDQPLMRKDLSKWVADKLGTVSPQADLLPLVHPILLCLQDKSAEVRKSAQQALPSVVTNVGFDIVREKCSDLFHGAQLQTVLPVIEALRPAVTAPAPAKSKPTAAASGKAKAAGTRGAKTKSVIAAPPVVEAAPTSTAPDFVLLTQDLRMKDNRSEKDRGMTKWALEPGLAPRKELIEFLHDQCVGHFSPELHRMLFSTDHYKERDFLSGMGALDDGIKETEYSARYVANSDLIFKYLTIRLADTSTSILIKALELIEHLCGLLDQKSYQLTEYEAGAFLPSFIAKIGDPKETMRIKIRTIIKLFCRIYPASKLFVFLIQALESKNAKTRIECLNEIGNLIQRNGLQVCNPSKTLPIIASQISDRDAGVRNAAINVIAQVYMLVGDQVFKYIGRINEKDRSLLEEKLKRLPQNGEMARPDDYDAPPSKIPTSPPRVNKQLPPSSPKAENSSFEGRLFSLDLENLNLPKYSLAQPSSTNNPHVGYVSPMVPPSPGRGIHSEIPVRREMTRQPSINETIVERERNLMMDITITQLTSGDAYTSINALKQLERTIQQNGPESIIPHINDIITAITLQVRIAFSSTEMSSPGIIRLCKHLVNTLVNTFSNPLLAKSIGKNPLYQCCQELLNRLLDPNLQNHEQGPPLSRALNVLMVRILENCKRNDTFGVLLEILEQSAHATVDLSPEQQPLQFKYTELVMKCIWKITKIIPTLLETNQLEVNQLLLDVHKFLTSSPPNGWKHKAEKSVPQGDLPLRTVKTILHELTNCLGPRVYDHMDLIPNPESSQVRYYLKQMLQGEKKKSASPQVNVRKSIEGTNGERPKSLQQYNGTLSQSTQDSALMERNSVANSVETEPVQTELTPQQIEEKLTAIFVKIGNKDLTKVGIQELYDFQKTYPNTELDVERHLVKTGQYFQGYIKRGLASIEESLNSENVNGRGRGLVGIPGNRSSQIITSSTMRETTTALKRPNTVMAFSQINSSDANGTGQLPYRDRLQNLQRMFSRTETNSSSNQPENSMVSPSTNEQQIQPQTGIPLPTTTTESSNLPSTQTVAQLKEQLAKIKSKQTAG